MVTTRGAGAASTSGSSRMVSANGPRKLLPNCSSKPSAVVIRVGGAITPALLISTSTGAAVGDQAVGELRHRGQVGQVDPADLEPGAGLRGQDLVPRPLPLGDRPDRHHHVRPGPGQAPGGFPAGAAVGAGDDDELACLIGNRVHDLLLWILQRPSVCYRAELIRPMVCTQGTAGL